MRSENGCLWLGENTQIVWSDRLNHGFQKAVPTKLPFDHPLLGKVLVTVINTNYAHGREMYYEDNNNDGNSRNLVKWRGSEHINLEDSCVYKPINNILASKKHCLFRSCEWKLTGYDIDQPWFDEILAAWDKLQGKDPVMYKGSSRIKIWVKGYPCTDGTEVDLWAWADLESSQIPWYQEEFSAASNSIGWGANNKIVATTENGQEIDVAVFFSPENETFQGYDRFQYGDPDPRTGRPRRIAAQARLLKKLVLSAASS
jgi:hypothetical protein